VLLIPLALIVPSGLLMFGFGAQEGLHWAVLYVGYGFINVVTGVAAIAMTYVMDSYFEVAAEALLLVNGMKNVAGFGFTHGFVPWTTSAGYGTVSSMISYRRCDWLLTIRTGFWSHGSYILWVDAHGFTILLLWCEDQELHYDATESHHLVGVDRIRGRRE
jgi:hypothetical protein